MVLSFNENRRFPKNATIKAFDRFTRPLFANWQKTQHRVLIVTSNRKLHLMLTANLCEYFVSIHGQHKICGIRDASSSSCSRSSHNLKMCVHIRLKSRLEFGDDASSIVNLVYHIKDDYKNCR